MLIISCYRAAVRALTHKSGGVRTKLSLSEQAIKLVLDYAITLTGGRFQLLAVENLDAASDIADQSHILQLTGEDGHAFAPHA